MENKLNHTGLADYSKVYAEKISAAWFNENEVITGKDILELTPTRQINLFVIKNLFFRWKEEAQQLRSPYFDYGAKPVKKAMKALMNELSRHIRITREDFEPLLRDSVEDSLLLIFSPYDYYAREVNNPNRSKLKLKYLEDLKKYVTINGSLLDAIIRMFEQEGVKKAFNDEAFRIFQEAFHQFEGTPEDISPYLDQLSSVIPLDTDQIYLGETTADKSEVEPGGDAADPKSDEEKTTEPPVSATLNERFNEKRGTLNESLMSESGSTLADELQSGKIENLKESLTVNQKFMFINKLFGGDSGIFHHALNRIEECNERDHAIRVLQEEVDFYKGWDHESEEVTEFMELLDRKFK